MEVVPKTFLVKKKEKTWVETQKCWPKNGNIARAFYAQLRWKSCVTQMSDEASAPLRRRRKHQIWGRTWRETWLQLRTAILPLAIEVGRLKDARDEKRFYKLCALWDVESSNRVLFSFVLHLLWWPALYLTLNLLSITLIASDEILFELFVFCLPVCSPTQSFILQKSTSKARFVKHEHSIRNWMVYIWFVISTFTGYFALLYTAPLGDKQLHRPRKGEQGSDTGKQNCKRTDEKFKSFFILFHHRISSLSALGIDFTFMFWICWIVLSLFTPESMISCQIYSNLVGFSRYKGT